MTLHSMLYPLTFKPIFKERVWGGRSLERLYHKPLPPDVRIGESWEISDRPGDVSVIANGPLADKDLHWLVENHAAELLGDVQPLHGRFPLLIKILDAQEKLSLQVHPPPQKAQELGGEPKTEMWYICDAVPGAELYVGLKHGISREEFAHRIQTGKVAECFHRIKVQPGDAMFLPSGRVHAIGGGLVIFEVQQNSDTTYRVFDWNRVGLDGQPRPLHIEKSLASIDFNDYEPKIIRGEFVAGGSVRNRTLVEHELFTVKLFQLDAKAFQSLPGGEMRIIAVLGGEIEVQDERGSVQLTPGQFCLVPASLEHVKVEASATASFLLIGGAPEEPKEMAYALRVR